jgi:hypothetical protein
MARALIGLFLYASEALLQACARNTDIYFSPSSIFSRSSSTADDDFFNEPSTMRPQMTAAAAQKDDDGRVQDDASTTNGNTYDLTARGTRTIHRAAPVA